VPFIFELKGRPRFDPLIVHIAGPEALLPLVQRVPSAAAALMERFWPGPLSVVLPKRSVVPDIVTAGLPSVAIRCPAHEIARKFIQAAGVPIAAPSANRFCAVSPTTAQHVADQFAGQVPHILDGGPCRVGVESTVVSFLDEQPALLRPGGVTIEEIEAVVGPLRRGATDGAPVMAPGQFPRHYSPSTPLILSVEAKPPPSYRRVGLLSLGQPSAAGNFVAVEVLSARGCLREAAQNLFAALRRLDEQNLDLIVAQPVPETGLGLAIMDRLRRAEAK
jgi:L-threonylcarbamoyladenylate synthase